MDHAKSLADHGARVKSSQQDLAQGIACLIAEVLSRFLAAGTEVVRNAVAEEVAKSLAHLAQNQGMHAQENKGASTVSLAQTIKVLGGCRTHRTVLALRCGALRGRQRTWGRRDWEIEVDDLQRWHDCGRPASLQCPSRERASDSVFLLSGERKSA